MSADVSSQRSRPGGKKTNSDHVQYGQKDGQIEFGHLHLKAGGSGECDVTSGVLLHTYDTRHYMTMDIEEPRKGWTTFNSPGPFQVRAAIDDAGRPGSTNVGSWAGAGVFILAENGDVIIRAPKGRVRISGMDVDIRADGPNNNRGTVNIDSNESINLTTGKVNIIAQKGIKFFTSKNILMVANTSIKFTSLFVGGLSSASALRPNKDLPITGLLFNGYSEFGFF